MIEKIISKNEAHQRLDKYLLKLMPEAGISFCCKMLRKKNITRNGKKADGKEMIETGDHITLFLSDETFEKMQGNLAKENQKTAIYEKAYQLIKPLEIIYEDDDFIFVNKPSGILSQQTKVEDVSVNEWMIGYLLNQEKISNETLKTFHPSVCNRLDRNTSGLVLCGKSLRGSQILAFMLKERTAHKYYRCIVKGRITEKVSLNGYLIKDNKNTVKIVNNEVKDASIIITNYSPVFQDNDKTELEVELVTGKTHQIRAHLSSEGHPILGDPKYGDLKWNQTMKYHRQLLHAYKIVFPQLTEFPNISGKQFICPLPSYWPSKHTF